MKVLVTGGAGYLGTSLVPLLLQRGHEVTVVDRLFFGEPTFPGCPEKQVPRLVRDDIRWIDGSLIANHDAVVDMAALSNDPAGELDPWKTFDINYLGRARVARLAREAGAERYVLTSSCSVYGFREGTLDETAPVNPLTAYARANVQAEADVLPLSGSRFCPTAIRLATLYGLSGRMRLDLAVNSMVAGARKTGKIPVMKDGTQWRPFLHVRDAARAIADLLESDASMIKGQVFNIGADDQNFQVVELAKLVRDAMTSSPTIEWYGDPDKRSYRVSFKRAREDLRFFPKLTPGDAAKEIEAALVSGRLVPSVEHKTVEWYQHLLSDPRAGAAVSLRGTIL